MQFVASRWFVLLLALVVSGCQDQPPPNTPTPAETEAEIKLSLARLGPDEQRIAEQQRYCPIMEGVRLGEVGTPFKVTVKGVSAYVCCEVCMRTAQEDPDQAAEKISQLQPALTKEPAPPSP